MAKIGEGVAILQGTTERPGEQPLRQANQFFYVCGVVEPRALRVEQRRELRPVVAHHALIEHQVAHVGAHGEVEQRVGRGVGHDHERPLGVEGKPGLAIHDPGARLGGAREPAPGLLLGAEVAVEGRDHERPGGRGAPGHPGGAERDQRAALERPRGARERHRREHGERGDRGQHEARLRRCMGILMRRGPTSGSA